MDRSEFVSGLSRYVIDQYVDGLLEQLSGVDQDLGPEEFVSSWWQGLDDASKSVMRSILLKCAEDVTFDLLCVIENEKPIADGFGGGDFKLTFENDDGRIDELTGPDGPDLHHLLMDFRRSEKSPGSLR
ncbi:MAG: hypothetical protein AAGB04_15895 [Pseudomonadota bacterium]